MLSKYIISRHLIYAGLIELFSVFNKTNHFEPELEEKLQMPGARGGD